MLTLRTEDDSESDSDDEPDEGGGKRSEDQGSQDNANGETSLGKSSSSTSVVKHEGASPPSANSFAGALVAVPTLGEQLSVPVGPLPECITDVFKEPLKEYPPIWAEVCVCPNFQC